MNTGTRLLNVIDVTLNKSTTTTLVDKNEHVFGHNFFDIFYHILTTIGLLWESIFALYICFDKQLNALVRRSMQNCEIKNLVDQCNYLPNLAETFSLYYLNFIETFPSFKETD